MPRLLDRLAAAGPPLLWLDDAAYSEALLAGGQAPWLHAAEYLAFRRKAQGLLRAEVVALPLGAFFAAWLVAHAALRGAMAGKTRAVVPARTLLADEALRAQLAELIKGLRAAFPAAPLALCLPSPRALVGVAYRQAFGADAVVEVGGDEADACAVYVAEFLRRFGESGVDALLLEETAATEPANADEIGWYQPVLNLAGHYRWDVGLHLPAAVGDGGGLEDVQFVIAPRPLRGTACGLALGEGFWGGNAPAAAPAGGFRHARVPARAVPEDVLQRLAALRA